jgi:hypothetical protein
MTKRIKLPYKLLIYDIETKLLKAWIWRLGEQVVRHDQLDQGYNRDGIISIAYKWYGEKETFVLHGDHAIEKFDKIIRQADVVLGKNSDRFDVKHINTQRMLQGLKPMPEWLDINDDLEKQLRKYFTFPSQSLDYVSKLFGLGGKVKMERQDWIDIANLELLNKLSNLCPHDCFVLFGAVPAVIIQKGEKALKKMLFYNKKDVTDTEKVLVKVLPYIKLKKNANVMNDGKGCILCGGHHLDATKIITVGQTKYQQFYCEDHHGYAGRATFKWRNRNKVYGRIS